ncbi:hypothetical protein [Bacillus phage Anath]|uniref:Uncharacterized protein n=1 Tax=Bacillus phage Anath TaxID=2108114 RepID=A0A2P1JUJ6_9CAUD|nr:hypothetical protein [Bacillus phage Anath]
MQNKVELNIPSGALFPFKVQAGQTVKIGQVVEIAGNRAVQVAPADSKKVIGVVYSGTVGIDGINVGYQGDKDDVATVVVMKPMVYLEAGASITAGDLVKSFGTGKITKLDLATPATNTPDMLVGRAVSGGSAGQKVIVALG